MQIAKVINGQVINLVDHREVYGRITPTDEQLAQKSYMRVNLFRTHNALTEKLVSCEPVIEGEWVYTVEVQQMTEEEIQQAKDSAMAQIRARRNQMLADTDWRYRRDLTTTPEWDSYCQALRDLPQSIIASGADPRTFDDWPTTP